MCTLRSWEIQKRRIYEGGNKVLREKKTNMHSKRKNSKRPQRMEICNAPDDSTDALATNSNNNWATTMVDRCRWRHACIRHVFPAIGNGPMNTTTMLVLFYTIVLVTLSYCVNGAVAFNLENRLPIVKYGDADTYFGYSVAGHIIENDEDDIGDDDGGRGGSSGPTEKWWVIPIHLFSCIHS